MTGLGTNPDNFEKVLSGTIFYGSDDDGPELITGNVYIENGIICDIEEKGVPSPNWIVPRFVNAHTHIGDAVLKDPPLGDVCGACVRRDLDALVRPPDGLKHRILDRTPPEYLIGAMEKAVNEMYYTGTGLFADFREGGAAGIRDLLKAYEQCHGDICPVIFGRPVGLYDSDDENGDKTARIISSLREVLDLGSGAGISGSNDLDDYTLSKIRSRTALRKKMFAIHAGEKDPSDIRKSLDLDPDLLIHMTHASAADLDEAAAKNIPIVVCPGSNFVTGAGRAPIADMIDAGLCVGVGTDNVMLNAPDMFAEMRLLSKVFGLSDKTVFRMCTANGAKALKCGFTGAIDIGLKADLMVLNARSPNLSNTADPLAGFVRRARADDIIGIL